jgi:hypothetical protein
MLQLEMLGNTFQEKSSSCHSRLIEKSHAFEEKEKAFNLTYSSSTPFGFMPTQTM